MKTLGFSIFDTKMEHFGVPFFMPTRSAAIRAFNDLADDRNSNISKHRMDYTLFELGEFDDLSGEMLGKKPINLGNPVVLKTGELKIKGIEEVGEVTKKLVSELELNNNGEVK